MATDVAVAVLTALMEETSDNADDKKEDVLGGDQSEARRLSATPMLKRRSSSTLSSLADIDLAELSLLDVLAQAATDVLGSIPAQRCIVYIYDKAANLLRPQVVVDCNDTDAAEPEVKPTESNSLLDLGSEAPPKLADADDNGATTNVEKKNNSEPKSPLVSFPPVVGMVSSCFLQRRCLRMQEPNPHRAFHREYDVPKDMQVDSILCAPLILYRRATAVIQVVIIYSLSDIGNFSLTEECVVDQLINRVDLTVERILIDEPATSQEPIKESISEVRLRRLKTITAMVKTGFSTKDEQKLLHFTTHIAQTIEMDTKKLANGRSHAKLREDKAKQALELLNALNGQIIARASSTDMLMPTDTTTERRGRGVYMRRATITRMPSQKGVLTDMLSALVVIMRLQAMFRGRRQRRADKFAEELEKFRRQRERMRSVIVMQRMTRTPEEAKPRVYEKPASRSKEDSHRSPSIRAEEPKKTPKSPAKPPPTAPSSPLPPPQPSRPPSEPTRTQRRRMSAAKIQTVFRRHRRRRQTSTPLPAQLVLHEELSKKESSAVKVQSFVRGNLARRKLQRALLARESPHVVCLRVALSPLEPASNQTSHDSPHSTSLRSQTCVYAMPERPNKVSQQRSSPSRDPQEDDIDPYQMPTKGLAGRDQVAVESRRLVATQKDDDTFRFDKSSVGKSKPSWNRLMSSVVWESSPQFGLDLVTPGVEFVKHCRPEGLRRHTKKISSPRATTVTILSENKPHVCLPVLASRTRRDSAKNSLLCCLLPTQTTNSFASIPVRPIAPMGRRAFKSKRRQPPSKPNAIAGAMCSKSRVFNE